MKHHRLPDPLRASLPASMPASMPASLTAALLALALALTSCQANDSFADAETLEPGGSPVTVGSTVPPTVHADIPVVEDPPATAPATTHEPWAPTEPCTVSALLVPSCGAWLGATTPSRAPGADHSVGLAEYEMAAKNQPDILHFYKTDAAVFPTRSEIALAERPGHQRSILFYNWKPSTERSWREVADGAVDADIAAAAAGIPSYGHSIFLAIWHEPENDLEVHGTAEDYVAMYRHVVQRLRDLGVINVVYVINFMGFARWSHVIDDFYPGDDVVDWIAYDPYGFESHADLRELLDEREGAWPGFYSWATTRAPGKPIMLGEWGIDHVRQPLAPSFLDRGVATLQRRFPDIKALVYWHDFTAPDGFVVRLDHDSPSREAYAEAYSRFANDPYFNSTNPDLAP